MSGKNDAIFCIFCKNRVPIAEFADHEKLELHQNTIKAKLGDMSIGSMMCKACMVPVNSEVIWNSHSKGRNHKKQVNFLNKVGKTEEYERPFSLIEFDKDSSDPVSDKMFSVVPDLFAPIIEDAAKNESPIHKETLLSDNTSSVQNTGVFTESSEKSADISEDAPTNVLDTNSVIEPNEGSKESKDVLDSFDRSHNNRGQNAVRKDKPLISDRRLEAKRRNKPPMFLQEDRGMQPRRGRDMGHHRAEERIRREREEPKYYREREREEREPMYKEREDRRNRSRERERKRKSKWGGTEKKISKSDYEKIADEFLNSCESKDEDMKNPEVEAGSAVVKVSTAAPTTMPPFPPPPLFPPPSAMFPNIDPYAGVQPAFNPPSFMGMPPMHRMPFPPPPPHMFPMPPPGLPMPPSSLPMPPSSFPQPPAGPMPSTSMPITLSKPLPPPDALPESPKAASDLEDEVDYPEPEEIVDRGHIDNTPKPSVPFFIEQSDVEIFIPEFFADRYSEHPHKGVVKADPDVALFEMIEKEKRANEPIPESIHLKMSAKPILVLNEDVKPFNPDVYESLKGRVLPIIKPNQKFVVIGSNCLKVTGPDHFVCDLCQVQFNDASKIEHLLSKPHLLNILWNWDPDSAQIIKDIESLNKNLFDKKVMEAANEIQKKEIKLLSEHQLRIRARILDENVDDQNKHFIKNEVFDPANFPDHDFSYLNQEKEEESEDDEDDDDILPDDPNKPNKMKILESGIMNMLKSTDKSQVVSDEDTALAALGICKSLMQKMGGRFKKCKHMPSEETVEKLKKVKHFFNNLLIIQQILDVYPSTALKENSSSALSGKEPIPSKVVVPLPAAFTQPAAFADYNAMAGFQNHNSSPSTSVTSDPRRSKQADTGYSLYSTSVDQAGIEWYRQNKLT